MGKEELGGDEEDTGWGCGQAPNGGRRDIGKRGIGFDSGQDGDKNDRLDGNGNGWKEEELARRLRSTRIRAIEGLALLWMREGRRRRRHSRRTWFEWKGQ